MELGSYISVTNLILNILTVMLVLCPILMLLVRQRRDLRNQDRVLRAVATLSVLMESDNRKTRHAVKDLAVTLKMQAIAESLEVPPGTSGDEPLVVSPAAERLLALTEEKRKGDGAS